MIIFIYPLLDLWGPKLNMLIRTTENTEFISIHGPTNRPPPNPLNTTIHCHIGFMEIHDYFKICKETKTIPLVALLVVLW